MKSSSRVHLDVLHVHLDPTHLLNVTWSRSFSRRLATAQTNRRKMASLERQEQAQEYLEKHQILELMDHLLSLVLFHRPEEPREFLSLQVEQLKRSRLSGARGPTLFTNKDLDTVFQVLDPAQSKHITYKQYQHALTTMGARNINECPDGGNDDKISHDTFRSEAMEALQRSSQTFLKPKSSS